jgi:tetratricopeptide (TPR) repeat protein
LTNLQEETFMKTKGHFIRQGLAILLVGALIFEPVSAALLPALAQAQENCDSLLREAEKKYNEGYFDVAIELLNRCLDKKNVSRQQKAEAYKLLGKAYISKAVLEEAKNAFLNMLEQNPQATLDPSTETPDVYKVFKEVKDAFEKKQVEPMPPAEAKKGSGKKWLWIGGGGAAVALAAILIFSGDGDGDDEGSLPGPEGRPPR